jgi:cytochrome b subunit of formate dehydrogenase
MIIDHFTNSIFGMALISAFLPSLITFNFGMVLKYDDVERKKLLIKFWVLGFLIVTMCVTGCVKFYIFEYGTISFNELKTSLWDGTAFKDDYASDIFILYIATPIFFTYLTLQLLDKFKKQLKLV